MADRVLIRDLLLRTIIGVNDDERTRPQDVLVNLALHTDTRRAAATDDIADAVNYAQVAKDVGALVEGSSFFLVEKLAEKVAALCLSYPLVQGVEVRVEKPGAVRFARSVGVEIYRERRS